MEKNEKLKSGHIVQINPKVKIFGACLMIVEEVKSFGIQGVVLVPARNGPHAAHFRAEWADFEWVGTCAWELKPEGEK